MIILGVRNFRVFEILEHLPYKNFNSYHAGYVLHSSPIFIQSTPRIAVIGMFLQAGKKTLRKVDPDQLASDLDLHCFKNRIHPG